VTVWRLVTPSAYADPVALRGPFDAPALAGDVVGASLALPAGRYFTVAIESEWDAEHIGAAAAWRPALPLGEGLWRLEGELGVGLGARPFDPDATASALPAVLLSAVGARAVAGVGFAAPARVDVLAARWTVPLLAEANAGARIGPVWAVARLALGPVWASDIGWDTAVCPGLWLAYKAGSGTDPPPRERP
jgi:hypothetical protein